MTAKINGTRICKNCKGICHEGSVRRNTGQRKSYYCSEACLRNSVENQLYVRLNKTSSHYFSREEARYTNDEWVKFMNDFYEPVNVTTK
jgi:hypothetical protein